MTSLPQANRLPGTFQQNLFPHPLPKSNGKKRVLPAHSGSGVRGHSGGGKRSKTKICAKPVQTKDSRRQLLMELGEIVCPSQKTRPKRARVLEAAIAAMRRQNPLISAAVEVPKEEEATPPKSDGEEGESDGDKDGGGNDAATNRSSTPHKGASRTPYIRSWRRKNRRLERELWCLLNAAGIHIAGISSPKSKEDLYSAAIKKLTTVNTAPEVQNQARMPAYLPGDMRTTRFEANHHRLPSDAGSYPCPQEPLGMRFMIPANPHQMYSIAIQYGRKILGMSPETAHLYASSVAVPPRNPLGSTMPSMMIPGMNDPMTSPFGLL